VVDTSVCLLRSWPGIMRWLVWRMTGKLPAHNPWHGTIRSNEHRTNNSSLQQLLFRYPRRTLPMVGQGSRAPRRLQD
jgi:hypothetical protein